MPVNELMGRFRWFVDPVPEWIIKDPRWHASLTEAVNFQLAQIDVQMKELTLEKARLKSMLTGGGRGK